MQPDRVVVGRVSDPKGKGMAALSELYANVDSPILTMSGIDAAFAKIGANLFLATKISFANELAALCDAYGAQVDSVVEAMGHDPRIGSSFLRAGVGFGGSCLPHQLAMTVRDSRRDGVEAPLMAAVERINHRQRTKLVHRLGELLGSVEGHKVVLLGLTFKPHTDDLRDAPALTVAAALIAAGAEVVAYDPMASARVAATDLVPGLQVRKDPYSALKDASALALLTEWPEFLEMNWKVAAREMRHRIIFDGRNVLDPKALQDVGFTYSAFGRMGAARRGAALDAIPVMENARRALVAALDPVISEPASARSDVEPTPAA
jgi:UDPglucose 6-dehydrogenase